MLTVLQIGPKKAKEHVRRMRSSRATMIPMQSQRTDRGYVSGGAAKALIPVVGDAADAGKSSSSIIWAFGISENGAPYSLVHDGSKGRTMPSPRFSGNDHSRKDAKPTIDHLEVLRRHLVGSKLRLVFVRGLGQRRQHRHRICRPSVTIPPSGVRFLAERCDSKPLLRLEGYRRSTIGFARPCHEMS